MERTALRERVKALLQEGNYVGAYGHVSSLAKVDPDRIELTGQVAQAIVREMDGARSASPDHQAWLRSQLAWVCRDVEGLSWLYREQLRGRETRGQDEVLLALKDLASGRPEDAMDRIKRGLEGARESLKSGEATDRVQGFLREAEQGLREGLNSVGVFFETMRRRGEDLRAQGSGKASPAEDKDPASSGDWVPPGKPSGTAGERRPGGSTDGGDGFKVDIGGE